ncbi:MAG: hypothetical protein EOM91_13725 [Sphingobacteriia bacterium]|nr:hypothetical protein [Sphingobacteriia bacterium]
MPRLGLNRWRQALILAVMIFTFMLVNLVWFHLDQAPPMWDQSHYLMASEQLFSTLSNEGWRAFFSAYTNILGAKAPLITVLPLPLYSLFGHSYDSALYINLVLILICGLYLYRLTAEIVDEQAALISVFILNTMPLAFAMSREFLVEYGLMTLVVAWMYHLVRIQAESRALHAAALGIILGLGVLMKISFLVYIAFPTLFMIIWQSARLKRPPDHWLRNGLLVILMGAVIAGPWYLVNLTKILDFVFSAGYGDMAKYYGTGEVFTRDAILAYWSSLIGSGISFYYFILLALCILTLTVLALLHRSLPAESRLRWDAVLLVSIWILVPFMLFTFSVNKDNRYSLPYYPALAILCAWALTRLAAARPLRYLPLVVLLFPAFNYVYLSFVTHGHIYRWDRVVIFAPRLGYAHAPIRESWPNESIIARLERDARILGKQNVRVMMLFDHQFLNRLTQGYYAENRGADIRFETVTFHSERTDDEIIERIVHDIDYILTKSSMPGVDFANVRNLRIKAMLDDGKLPFVRFDHLILTDGTRLNFYFNPLRL